MASPELRAPRSAASHQSYTSAKSNVDLAEVAKTLWRRKLTVLVYVLIFLGLGVAYIKEVATPLFSAQATLVLKNRDAQVAGLDNVVSGLGSDSLAINTEVQVLQSRQLMTDVVERLNLTDDPEFNRYKAPLSRMSGIFKRLKKWLSLPAANKELPSIELQKQASANALRGKIKIRNIPNSYVFQVIVETTEPLKSSKIANTLVDTYIESQLGTKIDTTEAATEWLVGKAAQLQQQLQDAQAQVISFRNNTDLVSEELLRSLEFQAKELERRLEGARNIAAEKYQEIEIVGSSLSQAEIVSATKDPVLAELLKEEDDFVRNELFEKRVSQVISRLESEMETAKGQVQSLEEAVNNINTRISSQSSDFIALQQLEREAKSKDLLYEHFLRRLNEIAAQQGIQQADSIPLSKAIPILGATSPNYIVIIFMAGTLGLVIGSCGVLFHEARSNTYRDASAIEAETGYQVYGQVPLFPSTVRRKLLLDLKNNGTSVIAESIRNLRTSIVLSNAENPVQVIMTSSSVPGEGKTTLALALSQNFGAMGKKVLLIEGDMRRQIFSAYARSGENSKFGLSDVLQGAASLDSAAKFDEDVGAYILNSGGADSNPADIFSSEPFSKLIKSARNLFDVVLIDTPPVLIVPDARIVAQHADVVLFAVKWDMTNKRQVEEALRMFETVGKPVDGIVLNQIDPKGAKRYGYGNAYGAYSAYSEEGSGYYSR